MLPEAGLKLSRDHQHPFRYYYWMWNKTSQTERVSVRYMWNLECLCSAAEYQLHCHCNRHKCPVVTSLSWTLTLSGCCHHCTLFINCCEVFSFSVSCVIYCEVHPIHLQLAATLEQVWANRIFKSSFSPEITVVELQYAWTLYSVVFAKLCETNVPE